MHTVKSDGKGGAAIDLNLEAREDVVLELLALSGDFPDALLGMLPGSPGWTRKVVRELVRDGLIRHYKHDGIKSLRLTQKARTMLLAADYERFHGLLDGVGELRSRKTDLRSRQRMHHIASVYVLLLETGILFHRDEKPPLGAAADGSRQPCFYSSYEVKSSGTELIRVRATRAVGALLSDRPYLVYHCGDSVMKWSSKMERKLAGIVEGSLPGGGQTADGVQGMMIGGSMDAMLRLLNSTGGYRNSLFQVDETFPASYYIPFDANGKMLLRLHGSGKAARLLQRRQIQGYGPAGYQRFPCDALDGSTPVLFACDLDLVKLKHYHDGLEQFEQRGRVLCADFQADVLKAYFGDLADIQPLDSQTIWEEILDGD